MAGLMGSTIAYVAASLDGFIATKGGEVGWLEPFNTEDYGYDAFLGGVDRVVMGRATYDQLRSFGAWPYAGLEGVVATRRPLPDPPAGVTAWAGGAAALATHLARQPGRSWVVGGGKLVGGLLEAGGLDELDLFVMPVLLGEGVALFPEARATGALQLRHTASWPNGVVRLCYTVNDAKDAAALP
jgi:dihydrofolate reductase